MKDTRIAGSSSDNQPGDWERLTSLMLTMARGMMRGRDRDRRDSMDVVQSLAGDLLKQRNGVLALPPESQRRVLAVALRNKLARYARDDHALKRRSDHVTLDDDAVVPAGDHSEAASVIATVEERAAMREALDVLEPESRAALLLLAAGASHAEIATALATTDQASRHRCSRATRDIAILVRRKAGHDWETIGGSLGLSALQAERRHRSLRNASGS